MQAPAPKKRFHTLLFARLSLGVCGPIARFCPKRARNARGFSVSSHNTSTAQHHLSFFPHRHGPQSGRINIKRASHVGGGVFCLRGGLAARGVLRATTQTTKRGLSKRRIIFHFLRSPLLNAAASWLVVENPRARVFVLCPIDVSVHANHLEKEGGGRAPLF